MRLAAVIATSVLVAACSQSVGGQADSSEPPDPTPPSTPSPATSPSSSAPPNAQAAPAASAPIGDVIGWIEAGTPVDAGAFHVAFRDGVTTRLGDDIAFVAPSGTPYSTTQCITGAGNGALTCLLDLTSPPPAPAQAEGVWKPGWIEFSGTTLSVGALRGDPGPFVNGTGTELTPGQSLTFADNRCRSDASGLYCVNYAHRSAVRIAADGVKPFGCLAEVPPPPESAALFSC
ncbi:hypothetical protein PDG61_06505 [Mycolicibacterium sp. BiH015]|uniref:hypothetical protein n=1 Tax=Mycolicibacterium sp. BiH015 TaxID=3018808 RepID=UPI0022E341E4|nr:hypothetical protein [Mycolicibacterium sp. BiH015]MDA2890553.1 hypothetical protein [Mycolicibacterium sp. BiH015]